MPTPNPLFASIALAMTLSGNASAVTLTADYSELPGVWITAAGRLQDVNPGGGALEVTDLFKANVSAAFTYMQNSILLPWNETITIKLFDFAAANISADGDSSIDSVDINNRPATSTIRLDSSANSAFFIDATPFDNSEYTMNFVNASLGGGSVNVGNYGSAMVGSAAENRTDVLTLFLHETLHSLGISSFHDRFIAVAGAIGTPNRQITVPTSLSGLPSDFAVPFLSESGHVDPVAAGGVFEHAITSEPSFGANDRWLPTGAELYAVCVVQGCAADQINPILTAVPEPSAWWMMLAGGLGLVGVTRQRRSSARV